MQCDVCIVGAGPLGLFVAHALQESGARVVVLDASHAPKPSLGVFWPSPNDPPTRAEVAHGTEMAKYLCEVHDRGVELSQKIGLEKTLPFQTSRVFRYGLEPYEREELQKASLNPAFGVSACEGDLGLQSAASLFHENRPGLLLSDVTEWRTALQRHVAHRGVNFELDTATLLTETTQGVRLETLGRRVVECEIAILGTAARTGNLLPEFRDILVPMADAVFLWRRKGSLQVSRNGTPSALALRGHNGHVAAAWNPADPAFPLRISGPRFLWPSAGAGLEKEGSVDARLRVKALDFHRAKTLPFVARCLGHRTWEECAAKEGLEFHSAHFGTDCLPCDELPVVGEFGQWGRVLGASGFLATGLSAGLAAAHMLADLVLTGASPHLHPLLSPRRFRLGQ